MKHKKFDQKYQQTNDSMKSIMDPDRFSIN